MVLTSNTTPQHECGSEEPSTMLV